MRDEEEKTPLGQCSPSGEKRILEHKFDIEDRDQKNIWKSCISPTGQTDSRLLKFSAKFIFSTIALIYCFHGLNNADECSSLVPFYTSLIGGIVGAWLNIPQDKKK